MQIAVDSSKRAFSCNVTDEINRIKQELGFVTTKDEDGEVIPFLPRFWKAIQKPKIAKRLKYNSDSMKNWTKKMNAKINNELVCPMNILSESNAFNSHFRNKSKTIETIDFVKTISAKEDRYKVCRYSKKVETLIAENSWIFNDKTDDYYLVQDQYDKLINDLQITYLSKNAKEVMNLLARKIFDDKIDLMINNRPMLLNILYYTSPNTLLESFNTQEEM